MNSPVASQPTLAAACSSAPAAVFGEDLDGRHSGDFQRLQRLLEHAGGFQLVFAGCLSFAYRQALIDRIAVRHPSAVIVDLVPLAGPSAVLDELRRIGPQHNPIHLVGVEAWLRQAGPEALHALNYRRESLAADVPNTLVLWLDPGIIATVAREAPDLWAWRAAVLDFSHPPAERLAVHRESIFLGSAERSQREQRLAEIADYLRTIGEPGGPDAELMLEASDIEHSLGRSEAALVHAKTARAAFQGIDDCLNEAVAAGRMADILAVRGQLDEALHIRVAEELPVYERLGDMRSKAVAQGKIADIFASRGQLDEALRIRVAEELPVYERLGDMRSKAVAQAKIGDILASRGQLDEALRILIQEALLTFQRLGDIRSEAVTQGRIADILAALGQLDEALRIRMEDQLPVYERLGDVREKAATEGEIAGILVSRGQLDEALHILREEVLLAFERLGDVRSKAITQGRIADILASRGQFDEALALHEQRLPVAERLGDIELIAHVKYSMASLRLQRGEHETGGLQRIHDDLAEAFAISRQLGRPDFIGAIGQLLAQVLVMDGEREQAQEVRALAEAALAKLEDANGVARVRALREAIGTT